MDVNTQSALITAGGTLGELALKETASLVQAKVESIKKSKDVKEVATRYDEIVTQLLEERSTAILIAQAYKEQLDKVEISDEDIEHLHNTVSRILQLFKKLMPEKNSQIESIETLQELISVDTLKTMQLLGFNYKAAIGEPLTEVCGELIRNLNHKKNTNPPKNASSGAKAKR